MNTVDIIIVLLITFAMIFSIIVIIKKRGRSCSSSSFCSGECSPCKIGQNAESVDTSKRKK